MISFKTFISEGLATLDDHVRFHEAGMPLPDKKEVYIDADGYRAYYENPEGGSTIHLIGRLGAANRKHDYTTRFDHLKDETVRKPFRFPGEVNEETEVENYKPKVDIKLRTTEKPFDHDAYLQLHSDAHDEGSDVPDVSMKFGDIYHHGAVAHDNVFYTDHHDTAQLPATVAGKINDKIRRGYTIHSMAHVYTPYGGITYAHMSMGNNAQNHLLKYDHQDNYYG